MRNKFFHNHHTTNIKTLRTLHSHHPNQARNRSVQKMPTQKPKKKQTPTTQSKPEPPPPNWPPLRPLVPSTDLYLEPVLTDQIYIIRNFFTANLCKSYVSFLTSPSSAIDLVTTPLKPKSRDHAVRVNDRFQVQDASFAEMLWGMTCLRDVVCEERGLDDDDEQEEEKKKIWGGTPLGLNPNIRIYRYTPGQFFAQHCTFLLLPIDIIRES